MKLQQCYKAMLGPLSVWLISCLLAVLMLPGFGASAALAATYYVSPGGTGSGASASSPRKAQAALDAARDGDTLLFLDGTYPALKLTARDVGPGTIALRAHRPILAGIDAAAGTAAGLRATGAVLNGGGGKRGLYVSGHDGLVVDGLKFVASGQGLTLKDTRNATVSRNHFHEHATMGLVVDGASTAVRVSQNYFTNQRTASVGAHMDYGLFAANKGTIDVDANLIVGRFNQGMSLKMNVTEASFTGNAFRCASGSCLMLGQETDLRLGDGSLLDRTVGRVAVRGNRFQGIGYVSVFVSNVEDVTVAGNTFSEVSRVVYHKYDVYKSSLGGTFTSAGRLPRTVRLEDNTISKAQRVMLEGRGTMGETVSISGNQMLTPLAYECRILRMSTAGAVVGEQTAGYPTVNVDNPGLACRRY
jgi:hypothetical protein